MFTKIEIIASKLFVAGFLCVFSIIAFSKPNQKPTVNHLSKPQSFASFRENKGQWTENILFKSDIPGGALFLEKNAFTYYLKDNSFHAQHHAHSIHTSHINDTLKSHAYKIHFLAASKSPSIEPEKPIREFFNYYLGNDQSKWASNVRAFQKVNYNQLYNNISLDIYFENKKLKYDFVIEPNADAGLIKMKYDGVKISLNNQHLMIHTIVGLVKEKPPLAYQIIGQKKKIVPCNFVVKENVLSFEFPQGYDKSHQLIIDPELIFSTYSGALSDNFGYTATYDNEGFLYSGSTVFDVGYPITTGAYQETFLSGDTLFEAITRAVGPTDIAITKYDTTGTVRIYSTLLGGSGSEAPHSIVCNENNELFVFGTSSSRDYPFLNSISANFAGGDNKYFPGNSIFYKGTDLFLTKFDASGAALLASTLYGGSRNDGLNSLGTISSAYYSTFAPLTYNYSDEFRGEVDIDKDGFVYVVSCTSSPDFPVTDGVLQTTFAGGGLDGCVVKFSSDLAQVIWSTYLGGLGVDALYSIDFDSLNQAYVAGGTTSNNLPVQSSSIQRVYGAGRSDGYVAKLNFDASSILASTYWGTVSYDQIYFVELDSKGAVFVYGQAELSNRFYIRNAAYSVPNAGQFVSKFSGNLNSVIWSTSFGTPTGFPSISPTAFLVDLCSKVYLSGWGGSSNVAFAYYFLSDNRVFATRANNAGYTINLPTTPDAFQRSTDSSDFYIMALEDDASRLSYATFFGGNRSDEHVDGGTSRFDRKGKIYQSVCAGCGGNSDFPTSPNPGAVSNTNNSDNCNNAVFKIDFNLPIVLADFTYSGCNPIFFTSRSKELRSTKYLWKFGDGSSSREKSPSHTYARSGFYKVVLIVSDDFTCNLADSIVKNIYVSPIFEGVSATASPTEIIEGFGTILEAFPKNPNFQYVWSPSGTLKTPQAPITEAYPKDTTEFEVEVTDIINNCSDKARVKVNVTVIDCQSSVFVPNAFTPNDDNLNEKLFVKSPYIESFYFSVYDRWGEKVFETSNQSLGWDGTFRNKKLDPDVYVFYLKGICLDKEQFFQKGNITLIR